MTMWTHYCREQAHKDYHKSRILKILRNAPNCEKEGGTMTMWTRYCREQVRKDYHKSHMLKILLLRAIHETDY